MPVEQGLAARNLSVHRGGRAVVAGVDLALEPGTLTAICGPNGAGKSTLIAALAGIGAPAAGTVLLDGAPLAALPARERARAIGFLPQSAQAAWDLRVEVLVGLGRLPWEAAPGRRARSDADRDKQAVVAAISAMELTPLARRSFASLSGGERARAMMARVLAGEPRWILADEPFAALDLAHQQRLAKALAAQAKAGSGVLAVMHDLALAMNHADWVVVLKEGQVFTEGPPENALTFNVIRTVWQVEARWLGEPGARALAV